MKKAIAVVSYARSEYFDKVLKSILSQKIGDRPVSDLYDVIVFQDGLWPGEGEANRAGHASIGETIRNLPDSIRVHRQPNNLAVALHFDYIERCVFVEHGYDAVVFCEEDMVLAPGYMAAMDLMAERFASDRRIGMFSANPGDTTCSLESQRANRELYTLMGHNWGFGLFRTFWERRQKFVDLYMKWHQEFEYRKRPSKEIFSWLDSAEFRPGASSQDYIKQCATVALGAVRIATSTNYGLPIGETGLHSKPELFKKFGFDRTVVFNELPERVPELDESQFKALWTLQAKECLKDHERFNDRLWLGRLYADDFDPAPMIAVAKEKRDASAAGSLLTTENDVRACYRLFLNREPENDQVLQSRSGLPTMKVLDSFLMSKEFSSRAELAAIFKKAYESLALNPNVVPPASAEQEGRQQAQPESAERIDCNAIKHDAASVLPQSPSPIELRSSSAGIGVAYHRGPYPSAPSLQR